MTVPQRRERRSTNPGEVDGHPAGITRKVTGFQELGIVVAQPLL